MKATETQHVRVVGFSANLSPDGFFRFARHFLRAEEAFSNEDGFSVVPYYLLSRSVELSLKAFLLSSGVPTADLKKKGLGHDLLASLERARHLGLEARVKLSAEELAAIELANGYYRSKGFEYFDPAHALAGYRELPEISDLRIAAQRLLELSTDASVQACGPAA